MDRATASTLHTDLQAMLAEFADKHNIRMIPGNFRYDSTGFSITVKGEELAESTDGVVITKQGIQMARLHGFDHEQESANGYTIYDYNPRARKAPWLISKGGKIYKVNDGFMRIHFHKTGSSPKQLAAAHMADEVMRTAGSYNSAF